MVTVRALPWVLLLGLGGCGGSFELNDGSAGTGGGGDAAGGSSPKGPGSTRYPGKLDAVTGAGGTPSSSGSSGNDSAGSDVGGTGSSGGTTQQGYPGSGFVVHEWGTDTVVVGSDGSLQRGLHHEEEDLPAFVYDRLKAGAILGQSLSESVTIKMETPVTYFYSDEPRKVTAQVGFPKGVLTQWYPAVTAFMPPIAAPNSLLQNQPLSYADPVLDPSFAFSTEQCREKFGTIAGGSLDWGEVSILPRKADVSAKVPPAALDAFTWSFAREVDSNPVEIAAGETEKFLFYRGLGDFELPVKVTTAAGGKISLHNAFNGAVGSVFFINVDGEHGAFREHSAGIAPQGSLTDTAPSLYGANPLATYAEKLGQSVTQALDATGLYHDEAVAMVNTWKRQWFKTPGTRLLYVIPQAWTDASIPLTISPKPDVMLRVMLIRVEVITPEQEALDVAALQEMATDTAAGRAHFTALGRFAEPRLRRALALQSSPSGLLLLDELKSASSAVAAGE
jgi:hypothetical protein